MGFQNRIQQGQAFEKDVEAYLSTRGPVALNGTEHTHPDFVSNLRTNTHATSKFIRFAPDGVVLANDQVWHWEAKAGQNIERDAYETYMKYHDMGCRVVLFVKSHLVHYQAIERVGFVPSEHVLAPYPLNRRFPLDADDWICPRMAGRRAGSGSGTPYKQIDMASMCAIPDFYQRIAA